MQLHEQVVKVTAIPLKGGYWKYLALMPDGGRIVVRRKATRLYQNAFVYSDRSGNDMGPGAHFSFGKNPASYRNLLKTFKIEQEVA